MNTLTTPYKLLSFLICCTLVFILERNDKFDTGLKFFISLVSNPLFFFFLLGLLYVLICLDVTNKSGKTTKTNRPTCPTPYTALYNVHSLLVFGGRTSRTAPAALGCTSVRRTCYCTAELYRTSHKPSTAPPVDRD